MKKLIILSVLFAQSAFAQMSNSTNVNLSIGNKTAEIGVTHTIESEIILGGSFAMTNSKMIEERINSVDRGSAIHKFNSKYTQTTFALMGANFDRINFIGKVGASYINQNILNIDNSMQTTGNFIKDKKLFYLAVGIQIMYQVTDNVGLSGSFDNVNGGMLGINFKIN